MKRRFRLEMLLVAVACFGPVIAAYLLYYYGDLGALPLVPNEQRLLVSPAVPLPPPGSAAAKAAAADGAAAQGPAADGAAARGAAAEDAADGAAAWGPKWSLLYVRTAACDEACRDHLVRLAQVHVALGRDQDRVRRIYVGPDAPAPADPALEVVSLDELHVDALLGVLTSVGGEPGDAGRVYVVDPHGNLVLSYPPDAEQEGLLGDLERLLDVSQIG